MTDQTLSEALALRGITHKPAEIDGKRDWFSASGEFLGSYDAHEGWQRLHEMSAQPVAA